MDFQSSQEQVTHELYMWEYRYRGWGLFDYTVPLHVPYVSFPRRTYNNIPLVDDGVVPSLFKRLGAVFTPPKTIEQVEKIVYKYPDKIEQNNELCVLILSFPKGTDIDVSVSRELLTTLSFTQHPVSFEIIATTEDIIIQLSCHKHDKSRVQSHVQAYFTSSNIKDGDQFDIPFNPDGSEIAVVDFGLEQETMLPIHITDSFQIDPLTSMFALFGSLEPDSCIIFQIITQGINEPLSKDMMYSVSDGMGGSFFSDFPEMLDSATIKTNSPLMSVVMRIGVQGKNIEQSEYLAKECITNITSASKGEHNRLIALKNEGYNYDEHIKNIFYRSTNRHGMILSVNELVTLFHYPNKSIVSYKLYGDDTKTKAVPISFVGNKYVLGMNSHNGGETEVSLNDEERLKHTHILGVTGVGKSTLIANMILNDIEYGNGCAMFDPHGDIVEDVLLRIPEHRKNEVIVIDPSDTDFPIGFNLLHAKTEAEKLVLSSDLVSAFREHSTAWGDTMTSVLSNAIDTFLDSSVGGTLIELKRFLLEDSFRKQFLKNVSDPQLNYYWKHEYGLVKKRISPLLTRIDIFLRPKIVRYMMAQKDGIDFHEAIESKKIILFKLSLGLIGEDNSYLLGSLFLSKLNQVALGRQNIPAHERHPFYIYLDECQHFMSPSIRAILSGTRKYGFGLTLAHQDLSQIQDPQNVGSLLSNPFTRVCFRLGDADARKIEQGYSFFEQNDFTKLERGSVLVRFGSSNNDCNIITKLPKQIENSQRRDEIIHYTQNTYAGKREDVEILLKEQFSYLSKDEKQSVAKVVQEVKKSETSTKIVEQKVNISSDTKQSQSDISQATKNDLLERATKDETIRDHRRIQAQIKKLGQSYGFLSTIEREIQDGKRVDVSLERNDIRIACEISVSNTADYEVSNITKCLEADYDLILVISDNEKHLAEIQAQAKKHIPSPRSKNILFIASHDVKEVLESCEQPEQPQTEVIKGFRVKTEYSSDTGNETKRFRKDIERILKRNKK